ncbi:hypothetical protein [Streptomyces sp. H27-H5]|uniref:hypothetical protein n=1 Tax=Streptomyces sp. H27-H5 TaxID=2996460 RepID=UPI00226F40FF|nr:hypothetical protein [Streptomyces sp. H27-H5]MCY0957730.1 hypothetical protein [Streptomyces sp. H27-H5]
MTQTRREITASAARYSLRTAKTSAQNPARSDQERAWSFYRTPEVRSFANWIGNAMSGARLYAGRLGPGDAIIPAPDDHPAAQIVADIAGGPNGQSQLLREYGRHLAVAGEAWTVICPRENALPTWHVVSVLEMTSRGKGLEAQIDGAPVTIPALAEGAEDDATSLDPAAIRVWDPSPEKHLEADSPVLGSLNELEELRLLGAAVRAVTLSRLTGRGILVVPKGTRFPSSPAQGDAEDDLIDVFMTVAETAIRDPASAAATVPIILEVPAEMVGHIQRLTFESDFDELAIRLREENIKRFATAADIPAEFLLGLGDVNHWGAWELTAEAIRLGIVPRLDIVAHAYTNHYLRPMLENERVRNGEEWSVFADSSALRVRTNRSETALRLYELGAISSRALRRETGFDEADAPTGQERQAPVPVEQPADSGEELPVDEAPRAPDTLPAAAVVPAAACSPTAGALAAADGLIWAALSSAGEKLRRTPACPRSERGRAREVQAAALHTLLTVNADEVDQWRLLDGAWTRVPEIATRYGMDPECLTASLDAYCRELIAAGVVHDFAVVPAAIGRCTVGIAA